MARKNKFSLNFDDFLDYAHRVETMFGKDTLLELSKVALENSKAYVQNAVEEAMNKSTRYHYKKGEKYATGNMFDSLQIVDNIPPEVVGTITKSFIGFDLSKSPEAVFSMYGTPHKNKDHLLYRAVKVKGAIRKNVDKIQAEVFKNAVEELNFNTNLTKTDFKDLNSRINAGVKGSKQHKVGK